MTILVISNFYPPVVYGGYEITCAEAVDALREAGADVRVLTSRHRKEQCPPEKLVARDLSTTFGWDFSKGNFLLRYIKLLGHEIVNQKVCQEHLRRFQPDVVYFWNLSATSFSLYGVCRRRGFKCGVYIGDHSVVTPCNDAWHNFVESRTGSRVKDIGRSAISKLSRFFLHNSGKFPPELDFAHHHTNFIRHYCEERGLHPNRWVQIPWGVDIGAFSPAPTPCTSHRLLYVGQVARHKGVHTFIEAVGILRNRLGKVDLKATIAGRCLDSVYIGELQKLVSDNALEDAIHFSGETHRGELPSLYRQHSILVFPSIWEEPLGLVPLEAMACGLAVVTTGVGGSGEVVEADRTALLFQADNSEGCASSIQRLIEDANLFSRIREAGRKSVEDKFTLGKTLENITTEISKETC